MGPSLLCPSLVGREDEIAVLNQHLDAVGRGRGGVVVLVGDAGAGKSRLVREAADTARGAGLRVLAGRAVPGGSPVPYRPLTEAFLAAFRAVARPAAPELDGFAGHLSRLVPTWPTGPAGVDDSPLLMGEAVLRLLRTLRGCVLVLEDLHWADTETLAVLDHLAHTLADEAVLVLGTSRPRGAINGEQETWRLGFLVDVILTRDTWMHRVDVSRATGRTLELTPEHDGRLVAHVVAEWARRHGQPVVLHLTGPAGGSFVQGDDGEEITLDAVEFCRVLSGRALGEGLLATEVPF